MLLNVFVLLLSVSFGLSSRLIPHFYCDHSERPENCDLFNVHTLRDQSRYKIISTLPYNEVDSVTFYLQKLAVMSPDFCETFPRLRTLYAASNEIEVIDQNAFVACYALKSLNMGDNRIQVLPADLFRNNFQLSSLVLQVNRIGKIADNLFEHNYSLQFLFLGINNLDAFPVSAVKNCKQLTWILLYSNNIFDFNATELIRAVPSLTEVMINGNMMPCSQIREMSGAFREASVLEDLNFVPRSRPFLMGEVFGYQCIDSQ